MRAWTSLTDTSVVKTYPEGLNPLFRNRFGSLRNISLACEKATTFEALLNHPCSIFSDGGLRCGPTVLPPP